MIEWSSTECLNDPSFSDNSNKSNGYKTYPEMRSDYTYRVGSIGEQSVIYSLEMLGYKVEWHHVNHNECDIVIPKHSIGVEVWNWSKAHCYDSRVNAVIENLKPYQIKILCTSFVSQPIKLKLESKGIKVIVTGFQVLPLDKIYQSFYHNCKGKKYYTDNTSKIVTNLLKSHLPTIGNVFSTSDNNCYSILYSLTSSISSYLSSFRSVLSGFIGKIKLVKSKLEGKTQDSTDKTLDSLQVKDDCMDKKNDSMVPKTLDTSGYADIFKCVKCGSNDNEKVKSTLYCDRCLTVMVIESLEDHGLVNYHGLQSKELKRQEDYVR